MSKPTVLIYIIGDDPEDAVALLAAEMSKHAAVYMPRPTSVSTANGQTTIHIGSFTTT